MDPTRVHLFITHLPVFGLFLGFLAALYGILRRDNNVKIVALAIIVIAAAGAVIAFQTGESAEETVEHISGVSHDLVEEHEESAELAMLFVYALGLLSIVGLYLEVKQKRIAKTVSLIILFITALTFYFVSSTASLGGKIRHTEIQPGQAKHQVDEKPTAEESLD